METRNYGLLYGLGASILWATFYIVGRYIFGNCSIDPIYLTFLRFFIAAIFLLSFLAFKGKIKDLSKVIKKAFPSFFILGASGILGQGALVLASLKYTTAARSCLLANSSPLFTIVLSYFVTREFFTKRKVSGIFIGLVGITLALLSKGSLDIFVQNKSFLLGDILALLSGVCWAVYTVFGKRTVSQYGGLISATGAIILGDVMLLFLVLILKIPFTLDFSFSIWFCILYLGVFSSALALVFWYLGLKYVEPGILGSLGYVTPVLTITLSYLLLKERASSLFFLGLVLVLLAIYRIMKKR